MSVKPKVVFWNESVTHYVVGRFNAIVRRGNLDFEAWFTRLRMPDRSWDVDPAEWEFRARVIPERRLLGRKLQLPIAELRDARPAMMVSGYSNASWALGCMAAAAMDTRTAFRMIPTYDAWVSRARWKERLKQFLFRAADGVKVPGSEGAARARHYGMSDDRIVAVTQSIDLAHYAAARSLDPAARGRMRKQLGLGGCVFIYVGRLWSGKGLDFLFDAYRAVRREFGEVSLLLVGDGVDERRYRELASHVPGVVFAGFVQPKELPSYYGLADVSVFPTLGDGHGLVVEEAMAAGLPLICAQSAGDIGKRLPDGSAGYVVPPSSAAPLAERMMLLARDPELRERFGREAVNLVRNRHHDRYAADFEKFVEVILSLRKRHTPEAAIARAVGRLLLSGTGSAQESAATVIGNVPVPSTGRDGISV